MAKKIPMAGERFGRLTVVAEGERHISGDRLWICECDCGRQVSVRNCNLPRTKSCGCWRKERLSHAKPATKHGSSNKGLYYTWQAMKQRCFQPNHIHFEDYGGRGITVCREWMDDFSAFSNYVTQLPHCGEPGRTMDRINNDGNYEPGNVRWATWEEQAINRRKPRPDFTCRW